MFNPYNFYFVNAMLNGLNHIL